MVKANRLSYWHELYGRGQLGSIGHGRRVAPSHFPSRCTLYNVHTLWVSLCTVCLGSATAGGGGEYWLTAKIMSQLHVLVVILYIVLLTIVGFIDGKSSASPSTFQSILVVELKKASTKQLLS